MAASRIRPGRRHDSARAAGQTRGCALRSRHGSLPGADATEALTTTAATRSSSARYRAGTGAAWLLTGLTSALLLVALGLDLRTGSYRQLLYVLIAVALTALGALLTTRKPEQPISWG